MPDSFFRVAARGIATDNMSLKYRRIATVAALILASACRVRGQVISSFYPPLGSSTEQVNINGSGFANPVTVTFHGTNASASATQPNLIIAFVPTGASSGPISVQVNAGASALHAPEFVSIGAGARFT